MDVQFPNGQLTYVAGEGITASGFLPLFGGLLQAHGNCPGETRVSFSFKVSIASLNPRDRLVIFFACHSYFYSIYFAEQTRH